MDGIRLSKKNQTKLSEHNKVVWQKSIPEFFIILLTNVILEIHIFCSFHIWWVTKTISLGWWFSLFSLPICLTMCCTVGRTRSFITLAKTKSLCFTRSSLRVTFGRRCQLLVNCKLLLGSFIACRRCLSWGQLSWFPARPLSHGTYCHVLTSTCACRLARSIEGPFSAGLPRALPAALEATLAVSRSLDS